MIDWTSHYAERAKRMTASEIPELLKVLDQPDLISFAGGIPDPGLFPTAEIADAYARVLNDPARAKVALQYAVSEGYKPLREWIAGYMTRLGAPCGPDNVVITNGSQQALDFLGKLFITPGDTMLVAWPTYLGALQAFNSYEPVYDVLPGPGIGADTPVAGLTSTKPIQDRFVSTAIDSPPPSSAKATKTAEASAVPTGVAVPQRTRQ